MIENEAVNEIENDITEVEDERLVESIDTEGEGAEIPQTESADSDEVASPDYGEIAASDLLELKRAFPELKDLRDITELSNPMRYAALRDLGLTAEEAYLATSKRGRAYDNRAHLTPSVPGGASLSREMSRNDYDMAREIFSDLSDSEIRKLYRKVTK